MAVPHDPVPKMAARDIMISFLKFMLGAVYQVFDIRAVFPDSQNSNKNREDKEGLVPCSASDVSMSIRAVDCGEWDRCRCANTGY